MIVKSSWILVKLFNQGRVNNQCRSETELLSQEKTNIKAVCTLMLFFKTVKMI